MQEFNSTWCWKFIYDGKLESNWTGMEALVVTIKKTGVREDSNGQLCTSCKDAIT